MFAQVGLSVPEPQTSRHARYVNPAAFMMSDTFVTLSPVAVTNPYTLPDRFALFLKFLKQPVKSTTSPYAPRRDTSSSRNNCISAKIVSKSDITGCRTHSLYRACALVRQSHGAPPDLYEGCSYGESYFSADKLFNIHT